MDLGLGSIGTIISVIVLVLLALPLLVAGVFVVLVVSNRADADPSGRRPAVVYTSAVSFISLFVTLFATYTVVTSLASLIGSHHSALSPSSDDSSSLLGLAISSSRRAAGPIHPIGDAAARGVVLGLLLAAVAGLVYVLHARAARQATSGMAPAQPAARVRSSYLAAVCFLCVFITVIATVVALYEVFQMIAPGVFNASGSGSATVTLRTFLPLVYLALASTALLVLHLRALPPDIRPSLAGLRRGPGPTATAASAPAAESEVPLVEVAVEVMDAETTPPRKRTAAKKATARKTTVSKATGASRGRGR